MARHESLILHSNQSNLLPTKKFYGYVGGILSTKLMTIFQYGLSFLWCIDFRKALFLFAESCLILCDPMDCSTPGFPVLHHLAEFVQTHVHWVSDAIQSFHPLSSPFPSALSLSQHQGLFQWVSSLPSGGQSIGASASVSVLSMNIQDWFPLGLTDLISLLSKGLSRVFQHHSWKASIPWYSALFMVQLSHPYMTTGKAIALTTWTFVGKVMSLLFNTLPRFVVAFLPRSRRLLISCPLAITKMLLSLPLSVRGQYQVFHFIHSHFLLL